MKFSFDVNEISYSHYDGFKVLNTNNIELLIGHRDFTKKLEKLSDLIDQQQVVSQNIKVDLNYGKKAFIRKN